MTIATINIGAQMPSSVEIAGTDLAADNVIDYQSTANQLLVIKNNSGVDYTPTLVGATASNAFFASGVGEVDLSTGKALELMANGDDFVFKLKSADNYLQGAVTITPATAGVTALVIEL